MTNVVDHPPILLATALVTLCGAAFLGDLLRRKVRPVKTDERADLDIVLTATLTLLGLLLGFTFSMAVSRYDQRKNHEATETNAIATECRRADLIPGPGRTQVRELLTRYTDERVRYYRNGEIGTGVVDQDLRTVQGALWSAVSSAACGHRPGGEPPAGLPRATDGRRRADGPTAGAVDRALPDRRHRQSARRPDPRRADQPGAVVRLHARHRVTVTYSTAAQTISARS